jgi:hypothetical protein
VGTRPGGRGHRRWLPQETEGSRRLTVTNGVWWTSGGGRRRRNGLWSASCLRTARIRGYPGEYRGGHRRRAERCTTPARSVPRCAHGAGICSGSGAAIQPTIWQLCCSIGSETFSRAPRERRWRLDNRRLECDPSDQRCGPTSRYVDLNGFGRYWTESTRRPKPCATRAKARWIGWSTTWIRRSDWSWTGQPGQYWTHLAGSTGNKGSGFRDPVERPRVPRTPEQSSRHHVPGWHRRLELPFRPGSSDLRCCWKLVRVPVRSALFPAYCAVSIAEPRQRPGGGSPSSLPLLGGNFAKRELRSR